MTTFIGEEQSNVTVFDVLCLELVKSTFSSECEVICHSTWVKDYPIPTTWPNFSSNYVQIKNIQKISDLLRIMVRNGIDVTLTTKSEETLRQEAHGEYNIKQSIEFHKKLRDYGVTVCHTPDNHAKTWITSENALASSANGTPSGFGGNQGNAGYLISRNGDETAYSDTIKWALGWIKKCENSDEYFSREHYFSK